MTSLSVFFCHMSVCHPIVHGGLTGSKWGGASNDLSAKLINQNKFIELWFIVSLCQQKSTLNSNAFSPLNMVKQLSQALCQQESF